MTNQLADYKRYYAQLLVQQIGKPNNEALKKAFQSVPRELFLGKGPWQIADLRGGYVDAPTSNAEFVYQNILFALDTDKGINNGLPSLHAQNLLALDINRGESIMHIGAGTGYYTAILAELTGEAGSVTAFEYEQTLATKAEQNLQQWPQASVTHGSVFDVELSTADVIYANAGTPQVETIWIHQLNDHGRLLLPLTCSNGSGVMLLVLRRGEEYFVSVIGGCGFIGCVGSANTMASDKLAAFFKSGRANEVTRLYLSEPENRRNTLLSGDGWYLCSE